MVAPDKLESTVEFSIVKAWIWAVVPRRTRLLLDSRIIANRSDLILALQDHLVIEGEKGEGQVAVFREQHHGPEHSSSERRPVGNCYKCGKPGHKMADCWQKTGSGSGESAKPSAGGSAKTIICYTCGVEGHRSPQCPKKGQQEEPKPKEGLGQAKPVRRLKHKGGKDTVINGIVNGREATIVLDSGTAISVVPAEWVEEELETGEEVPIVAFGSNEPVYYPVAKVQFKVMHLEWEEEVALAPPIEGQEAEVLCSFDIMTDIGFALFSLVREREKVLRAEAQKQAEEDKDNAAVVAQEKPRVSKPVVSTATPAGSEAVGADKGGMAADRPVKPPESVPPASEDFECEADDEEEEEESSFAAKETDDDEVALLAEEKVEEKELFCLKPKGREDNDLVVPPVGKGSSHRAESVEEVFAAATEDIIESNEEEDLSPSLAEEKDGDLDFLAEVEDDMVELVAEEKAEEPSLAEEKEELVEEESFCLKPKDREEIDLVVPPEKSGNSSRVDLVQEIKIDPSLKKWRTLASKEKQGDLVLRKFVQGFARMSSVLSPWIAKLAPSVMEWTEEGLQAFRDIKVSLVHLCILTIPSEEDVFVLHCAVSGAGVGATLNDNREGEARRTFTVITDHKALVSFLKSKMLNRRLQGWMQQLLQYDFSIEYRPGVEHLDADALSRQAWQSSEGDPWRPAAILQREEKEQEQTDELRAAPKLQLVGGDVGTSPTNEMKETLSR